MVTRTAKKIKSVGMAQPKISSFISNKENKAVTADGTTPEKSSSIKAEKSPKRAAKSPAKKKALQEENDSNEYVCLNCPSSYTSVNLLSNHSKTCCKPPSPVASEKTTKVGRKVATKVKERHTCEHCEKTFANKHNLNTHLASHFKIKNYVCEICTNRFRQSSHLVVHMRTHTNERPYKCDFCPKAFTVSNALTVHRRIHTGERPYKCTLCEKGFTEGSKLKIHMRSHTNEKPFECEVCHDRFKQQINMRKHMENFHTLEGLEAKYECDLCNKKFKDKNYLKVHMKYHTGDKEHSCELCNKSFITSSELKLHINYHNGIKDFKCEICQKEFYQAPHLKHHMKMHKSGKVQCNNCKRFFAKDSKFQHRCLPPSRSVSAKTHQKIAMKKAKMGNGRIKVHRVNKPQIEDELTQTGFDKALHQEVDIEDDQIQIIENEVKRRGPKRKSNRNARAGRPAKQAKTGTAMTELVMIDDIKEEPEDTADEDGVDSLMESSRIKVQRIYTYPPNEDADSPVPEVVSSREGSISVGSTREGSITPEMMEADDDHDGYILGDEEGIITFNPQMDTGSLLNNDNFTVIIQHDFESL